MPWVEISQAAFTLGISERTLRNWIKSGKVKAKTENGHRMVELPDEEFADAGGADDTGERIDDVYGEESEGNFLDTQKRLEVALLECGRVKGALSSQERIMETLSANIAELTAKLQKSQNQIWRWIVVAVSAFFLGIVAYFVTTAFHERQLRQTSDEYQVAIDSLRDDRSKAERTIADKEAEKLRELAQQQTEFQETLKQERVELRAELEAKQKAAIREVRDEYAELMARREETLNELRAELARKTADLLRLTQERQGIDEELAKLRQELEDKNRMYDRLLKSYNELEARNR